MHHRALPPSAAGAGRGSGSRWTDLGKRAASAAILAPVALACVWFGGLPFAAMIILLGLGAAIEWVRMCGHDAGALPSVAVPVIVVAACILIATGHALPALAVLAGGAAVLVAVSRQATLVAGVLYVGVPALALIWLRDDAATGRVHVIFMLLLIWASDIGAYLVGRVVGGPRLAPRISPGKTWSGAVGGLVCAVAVGVLAADLLHAPSSVVWVAVLSAGLGVVSQAGDLFESLVKRHFGVKDSGHLIPGHGGLLDRLDAVLAVAPVVAVLALAAGRGVVLWE